MKGHLPRFTGGEMVHSPIFDLVKQAILDRILCRTMPCSRWGNATGMVEQVSKGSGLLFTEREEEFWKPCFHQVSGKPRLPKSVPN